MKALRPAPHVEVGRRRVLSFTPTDRPSNSIPTERLCASVEHKQIPQDERLHSRRHDYAGLPCLGWTAQSRCCLAHTRRSSDRTKVALPVSEPPVRRTRIGLDPLQQLNQYRPRPCAESRQLTLHRQAASQASDVISSKPPRRSVWTRHMLLTSSRSFARADPN